MSVTRRRFVAGAMAAGAAGSLGLAGCAHGVKSAVQAGPPGAGPAAELPTLRAAGVRHGLLAGCAVQVRRLRDTPAYAALVAEQAGIVVEESALKMGPLRPAAADSPTALTEFFFDDADYLFEFAQKNGMKVRGHNFVWHRQLPKWFSTQVTKENAERVLVEHIERVGGRYAGRVHSWDVANEAIQVKDGLPGGLRDSPWQRVLGEATPGPGVVPRYLEVAYRTARRVDPQAMLVYNDYGIEGLGEESQQKRDAVLALLRAMQARGIPVDGLGVQSHLSAGTREVAGGEAAHRAGLRKMMAEARGMGLKVLITEMDVNDRELPADVAVRDKAVAAMYGGYLREVLQEPAVVALLTWGITDKYTWLNGEDNRKDGLPERCLPFDAEFQPKAAFAAMLAAIGDRG